MATQVPELPWFTPEGDPTEPLREFFDAINNIETEIDIAGDDFTETTDALDQRIEATTLLVDEKSGIEYEDIRFTSAGVLVVAWEYTASHTLGTADVGVCWFKDTTNGAFFLGSSTTLTTITLLFDASFDPTRS